MRMVAVLTIAYLLLVPAGVMLLAKRWTWIEKVSPMTLLYIIGLVVGNSGLLRPGGQASTLLLEAGDVTIPLAIPLMLMGCNLQAWSARKSLRAFLSGVLAVLVVTVAGFFLFRGNFEGHTMAQVCAVTSGLYTGGVVNIGAIKQGIGMRETLYLLVSSYDLVITGLYLLFIVFFGKRVFRRLLPTRSQPVAKAEETVVDVPQPTDRPVGRTLLLLLFALLTAGAAMGLTWLILGSLNTAVLMLLLTTLAIGVSFLPVVRRQGRDRAFQMGLYCVYVFCLAVASCCDVRQMNLTESVNILFYIFFVIFGSLSLQVLLGKLMRLDGDTVLVSSVALINSPPFVPMVAAVLGNKEVVMTGISVGLLGYMVGNYLGIGLYHLLLLFC